MPQFQIGDQVECINPKGPLIEGRIYNVVEIYGYLIELVDDDTGDEIYGSWSETRFKLRQSHNKSEINHLDILKGY